MKNSEVVIEKGKRITAKYEKEIAEIPIERCCYIICQEAVAHDDIYEVSFANDYCSMVVDEENLKVAIKFITQFGSVWTVEDVALVSLYGELERKEGDLSEYDDYLIVEADLY